jgi:Fe-S cluster assembly scaffold protein SufB
MAASAPKFDQWLTHDSVRDLSRALSDPPSFSKTRDESFEKFLSLPLEPNPLYRGYGYFSNVDLSGISPRARGSPVPLPKALPGAVRIVHDAAGTRAEVPDDLASLGVTVHTLPEIWASPDGELPRFLRGSEDAPDRLSALATTLLNRGYLLDVPPTVRSPVRVQDLTIFSAAHEALSVRRSIRCGTDTQLLVTEEVYSTPDHPEGQRLYGSSSDLELGDRSKVLFLTVHAPDLRTISLYRRSATTGAQSRLGWIWNGFGGFRTRNRNHSSLTGTGSIVDDLQTFFGAQGQAFDSSVDLTHIATDTHGQSITRGVFRDDSRGMSRGLVRIEHEARKTISFISEHAMLLSKGARSDTIPILEILCRDVKATHSTSVAPVDAEKVFYLESRGISDTDSIRMIAEGFLSYVFDRAPIAGLRDILYPDLALRWDGYEIAWTPEAFPALPALEVSGTESAPEWRFDAKLR